MAERYVYPNNNTDESISLSSLITLTSSTVHANRCLRSSAAHH